MDTPLAQTCCQHLIMQTGGPDSHIRGCQRHQAWITGGKAGRKAIEDGGNIQGVDMKTSGLSANHTGRCQACLNLARPRAKHCQVETHHRGMRPVQGWSLGTFATAWSIGGCRGSNRKPRMSMPNGKRRYSPTLRKIGTNLATQTSPHEASVLA